MAKNCGRPGRDEVGDPVALPTISWLATAGVIGSMAAAVTTS